MLSEQARNADIEKLAGCALRLAVDPCTPFTGKLREIRELYREDEELALAARRLISSAGSGWHAVETAKQLLLASLLAGAISQIAA